MFLCHFPSPATLSLTPQKPGSYPALCPLEPGLSSPSKIRGGGHPVYRLPPIRTLAHGEKGVNGNRGWLTWWPAEAVFGPSSRKLKGKDPAKQ